MPPRPVTGRGVLHTWPHTLRHICVLLDEVAYMGIVIAISGGVLQAIGALIALQERDVTPKLLIARGGSALAAGMSACGWRADELARLARTLEHNRLALLAQLLPALNDPATELSPRDLALLALGERLGEALGRELPPVPAASDDPLEALLWELTRGVELRDVRMPLAMPVRAYKRVAEQYKPEPEPRLLTSGNDARYAVTLATALRCAAFTPELAGAPTVGGALLTAWPDARGEMAAWRRFGGDAPLISIGPTDGLGYCQVGPNANGFAISIPRPGRRDKLRERMDAGYNAVRKHIGEVLSFC